MSKYITLILLCLSFSTIAQQKIDEELVIFVQKSTDSEFTTNNISELEAYMKKYKIPTKVIDVEKTGAPKEIGYTPYIVYRNHLGNKVYKGRYTTHKRILNFIRTVRQLPQEPINYEEKDIFVWEQDRTNIIFKLKITDLQGSLAENFNEKQFKKNYLQGLKAGFKDVKFLPKKSINNSEEMFYCNFYPYRGEDGKVYISAEIFSHYDCIVPIYKQFDTPIVGNSINEGFQLAAANIFAQIKRLVVESEMGDALNFIKKETASLQWKDLKLKKLKAPKAKQALNKAKVELPKTWTMIGPLDESTPLLAFHFPAPLMQYGGEIKKATGTISLENSYTIKKAKGTFIVDVSSLEMGESSLNSSVKKGMLYVDKHPTATLEFVEINSKDFGLAIGKITRADIKARLSMVGKTSNVVATSQFEPYLDDDGALVLHVTTQFVVQDLVGSHGVDGPDGPEEANNTLYFNANFLMKAAEGQ